MIIEGAALTLEGSRDIIAGWFIGQVRCTDEVIVTIDGPVASGKSTAARNLAAALGFKHLDSGAIYRCLALLSRRKGVDPSDRAALRAMFGQARIRSDGDKVYLDGLDVTEEIRLPETTKSVRPFAENPDVREFVKTMERRLARGRDIVVEGRDMGSVVFPDAEVKIYLTASAEERAGRRFEELRDKGAPEEYETVLADLRARDHADMTRRIAPLVKPDNAVEIDSTGWSAEETLEALEKVIRDRVGGR